MDTVRPSEPDSVASAEIHDQVHVRDPHAYLRPNLRVKGEQGKSLGKVESVEHDAAGVLTGIMVVHGMLPKKRTLVPVDRIKQVNQDAVVIEFSASSLNRLPRGEPR